MYTEPVAADLRMRWPAFVALDDPTIAYWLTDAHRFVDQSWTEGDYAPALIAVACANMLIAETPGIADADFASLLSNGVTDFQSGGREGFRASFSADAINQALSGGYEATKPGQEYLRLLARNKGGPRCTAPGYVCGYDGYNGFAGPLGYPARLFPC